ncbi:MAG: hypothetical protein ACI4HQ_11985 [Acetatifactor sp.]
MKKKLKALVLTIAAIVLCAFLPESSTLSVKAAAESYSVEYIGGAYNAWRYQPGNVFDAAKGHGPLGELLLKLKDGDTVIVYQGDTEPITNLDLGSVKLNNLTVHQGVTAVVFTGGITECYVLAGAYAAINGDVTTAHIYGPTTCTFNNNVLDMYLHMADTPNSNISCNGTVGYFNASYASTGSYWAAFYDIAAGQYIIKDGKYNVPSWAYGSGPSEAYLKAKNEAAATPGTPGTTTPGSDDYDDVPKTGDSNSVIWLLCASALFFTGSLLLKRKGNS